MPRARCWTVCLALLLLANATAHYLMPTLRFRYIVVHHTATNSGNYASIRNYHRNHNKNADAAYHLILSNGTTPVPFGHLEATGRYRNLSYATATRSWRHNYSGIHLCLVGNYQAGPPSAATKAVAGHAIARLQKKFHIPDGNVIFHKDASATECPGRFITRDDFRTWSHGPAEQCPPAIAAQQQQVIDRCGFSLMTFPRRGLLGLGAMNLVGLLLIAGLCHLAGRRKRNQDELSI